MSSTARSPIVESKKFTAPASTMSVVVLAARSLHTAATPEAERPPEVSVAEISLAAPAGRGLVRWSVVDPDPALLASQRVPSELGTHLISCAGTVPPGTDGEESVLHLEAVAIDHDLERAGPLQPPAALLIEAVEAIEVVVAGAHDELRTGPHPLEVCEEDHDLGGARRDRHDVDQVAGDHDEVELPRHRAHPVQLLERVVQIRYEKESHGQPAPTYHKTPGFSSERRSGLLFMSVNHPLFRVSNRLQEKDSDSDNDTGEEP